MPLPTSLVVKNGSNTRGSTSAGMPSPVSATRTATNSPLKPSSLALPRSTIGLAVMVSVPPDGMASRALNGEIEQRELELARIDLDEAGPPRHDHADFDVAAQRAAEHVLELGQPFGEVDHARLQRLPPREGEQLPGQAFAALRRIGDGVEQPRLLLVADVAAQPVHAAADDHQQIVEVVGDAAGQLADRFEPLRLAQRAFRRLAAIGLLIEPPRAPQRDPEHGEDQRASPASRRSDAFPWSASHSARMRGAGHAGKRIDREARKLAKADAPGNAVDLRIDGVEAVLGPLGDRACATPLAATQPPRTVARAG